MTGRLLGRFGLAGGILFALVISVHTGLEGQDISLPLGTAAPPASLQDLAGNPVQILDYVEAGKPTLIEFWASWCWFQD